MTRRIRKILAIASCAAVVSVSWTASSARGEDYRLGQGPEVGLNAGPAIAIDKFQRTVDGDVGGTFGFSGGYRFNRFGETDLNDVVDNFAISLLVNPQFTFFPTETRCCDDSNSAQSIFSLTAGPKFSFGTGGPVELYAGIAGGYYRDMSGPLSDDGGGFNAGGGINFAIAEGASLGLFGRYDYARMVASDDTDCDRQWASTGLAFTYVFTAPEVVAAPPPPPARPAPPPPPPPATERRGG